MSKLPWKGRAPLQREPPMQRCETSARDRENSNMSGVQRTVGVWYKGGCPKRLDSGQA